MRPQMLIIRGIGSYNQEEPIDFTGKNFIAVVGDTGAGKSTILEAICYALYNRCTYASNATPLIADGGDGTMSVKLTFTVGNRRWHVARSASRHTPTSVHQLTCLDTGVLTTSAKAVNAEIRRIIGLDYDTFLRAVVLPQGRFQELLRMNDRERGQVLDSVLGLEQLVKVRDHTKKLQLRLKDRLTEYQLHRRRFLDNPAETLTTATTQHSSHGQHVKRLDQARTAVTDARADKQRAATAAVAIITVKDALSLATPSGAEGQLHALAAQAHDLDGRREKLRQLTGQLQTEHALLREQTAQAEQHTATAADTATAISILTGLAEQIPQQRKHVHQLVQNTAEVEAEKAFLNDMQHRIAALEPAVTAADKAFGDAEKALEQSRQRGELAIQRLKNWRDKTTELQTAHNELAELTEELDTAKHQATEAKVIADQAEQERDRCEHAHTQLVKANAVAEAAADLEPGAPCITCSRPLPSDFTPPAVPDLSTINATRKATRTHAGKTDRLAAVAAARVTNLEQERLPAAQQKVTTADTQLHQAFHDLREVIPDGDLVGTDEQILRQVHDATATAEGSFTRALAARDTARAAVTTAQTTFDTRSQAHAERVTDHEKHLLRNRELEQTIASAASRLTAGFAIATPLDVADIQRQNAQAQAHQQHLQHLTDRRAAVDKTLADLRQRVTALDEAYTKAILKPAAALRDKLMTLSQRVSAAAAAVEHDEPPTTPDVHASLNEQAQWAAHLLTHTQKTFDICTAVIAGYRHAEQQADEAMASACKAVDASTEADLEQQYLDAYATLQNLKRQIDRAQAELPVANALQQRIDAADDTVNALDQLHAALADGKFIAEAVRRRVQALLYQASDILFAISGGRYRFAPEFRILDLDTTAERGVKTLSGGETFLASLALALAVVELASNATGHVEALFLDEGFGTLDTTRLREALHALTGHSTTGRLVTVISHMRSITENAEHVLVVEKTLTTSRTHWADADEKERIINDDLGRGLLE
jgi:exonuclease SbcC